MDRGSPVQPHRERGKQRRKHEKLQVKEEEVEEVEEGQAQAKGEPAQGRERLRQQWQFYDMGLEDKVVAAIPIQVLEEGQSRGMEMKKWVDDVRDACNRRSGK